MDHSTDDTPHLPDRRAQGLLDRWIAGGLTSSEEAEAKRVASDILGRSDGLDLFREILAEEGMMGALLRRIRVENGGKSEAMRTRDAIVRPLPARVRGPRSFVVSHPWYGTGKIAVAMFLLAAGLGALGIHVARQEKERGPEVVMVATLPGQRTTVELPDGSRAMLAPNTELRYTISPNRGPREVTLAGEAYFEVRHDEARSFRVRTASAVVEDLGTAFLVREYTADPGARVAVRSGAVAISAKGAPRARPTGLRAGQAVDIDARGTVVRLAADTTGYWSWTAGRLVFDGTPLPEVLTRLSHWYGVEFRMTDSTLAEQYFTGSFDAASLPRALEILGPLVHARFEQQARLVIVTPRPGGR